MRCMYMKDELAVITKQLGREPENFAGVRAYCPFDYPAVVLTAPYSKENGVFPTLYWLTCPYLVKSVARLEDEGLVRELTELLKRDTNLQKELMKAHQKYALVRFSYLGESEKELLSDKSPAILRVLREAGVGGIMDKQGIKCLHTHLADYLVNKQNPIGSLVWQKTAWPSGCSICMSGSD
ncbi:MAG: DUF501 domain-containing protein [Firmicutes bacterium]|nr:DUF501 domain-containing protein [Bacillota bacterium]